MSDDAPDADVALLSPASATSQQSQWPRPRSPIPPHRLAKLANALGISTPVPPIRASSDTAVQPSPRSTSRLDWRAPSPSGTSTSHLSVHSSASSFQSKFLLHVIPPPSLPHDTNAADVLLTRPPASASGYHTQFRRGTLVPLLPSFQAQLGAIAKEYALPSTTGMILYLVTSSPTPSLSLAPSPQSAQSSFDNAEDPGPRLSEEIWKHLWLRVVKTELGGLPSRAGTPVGLGLNANASPGTTPTLRPLVSSGSKPPLTPTASSSISSSTNGASDNSQSEATTPDTSAPPGSRADSFDLPGLHSPSLVPILAKVEFDIDRRKAAWYGPWLRSRKQNHQKRAVRSASEDDGVGSSRLNLKLVDRQARPRFLASNDGEDSSDEPEYVPRVGSPEEDEELTAHHDALSPSKKVPPRLVLPPHDSNLLTSESSSPLASGTRLAYRESDTEDETSESRDRQQPRRSALEEKRGGAFFDDLVLGLRFNDEASLDYDENDPYDRRKSQFIMKQRLDELERNLQQYSPRKLRHESEASTEATTPPRSSLSKAEQYLSPSLAARGVPTTQSEPPLEAKRWPAVPYSQLNGDGNGGDADTSMGADDDVPAPPKFALNGVSNAIPFSPYKPSFSAQSESEESKARRHEHDDGHEPSYPAIIPPSLRRAPNKAEADDDAVIPLSPDPFGRFPSETMPPVPPVPPVPALPSRMSESSHRSSSSQSRPSFSFDSTPEGAGLERDDSMSSVSEQASVKLSSRFSLDSDDHAHAAARGSPQPTSGASALNPVKSIRTLWRKSRKASVSSGHPPAPGPIPRMPSINGGQVQAQAQAAQGGLAVPMPRVSEEVVTNAMLPPGRRGPSHPAAAAAAAESSTMTTAEMMRRARGEQGIGAVHFDQESPYPIRRPSASPRSPTAQLSPRLSDAPVPAALAPSPSPSPVPSDSAVATDSQGSPRKSILKTWAGSRTSGEDAPGSTPVRKRRPSMLDMVRNSRTGEAPPPSPMLPERYARQSESSTRSSDPRVATPADDTFEIVDGSGGHGKAPSLSYPYHELDHQS